jgi:selenide,water dikinase
VTGTVHPRKLITNSGTQPGDCLVLTKPLGTGVISTALKNGKASQKAVSLMTASMTALNNVAAGLMLELDTHSCTDITGFGLLGHASHLIQEDALGIEFDLEAVPVFPGVVKYIRAGLYPGGLGRNRDFYSPLVEFEAAIPDYEQNIFFDPQTSGGLLISLAPANARKLVTRLHKAGISHAAVIGRVVRDPKRKMRVK